MAWDRASQGRDLPSGRLHVEMRNHGKSRYEDDFTCTGTLDEEPFDFQIDDYGQSTAKADGAVPAGLEDKARLAIANCPEFAIDEIAEA